MSERDFQRMVIDYAKLLNYRVAHFRPALRQSGQWSTPVAADGAGFPDLVLVGHGRVLFVELKSARGRLTPTQRAWRDALRENNAEYYCWQPTDWHEIEQILGYYNINSSP